MKAISSNILLLPGFLLLFGCNSLKQEVDPRGLGSESEKIVVACFISPQDTILAARIGRSSTVLGADNQSIPDITNATVTLSDGTRSVVLKKTVDKLLGYTYYQARSAQLPIVAGKTYALTVSIPNGQKVDASCTVPEPVSPGEIVFDSTTVTDYFGQPFRQYNARLRWLDPAGQPNFYRVEGTNTYRVSGRIQTSPNAPARDTITETVGQWGFINGSLLADAGQDGQLLISTRGRLSTNTSLVNGRPVVTPPKGQVTAYLLNVDENYYRYHDEVERQSKVRNNPFAEPVLIQTNIRGGLGCFGAYNKSTLVTNLK